MAATRTPKAAPKSEVVKGFSWTMAAVIEGPESVLTEGTVVEVKNSKGAIEHVTIGVVVERTEKFGLPFVKTWPAKRVKVDAAANGNGSHDTSDNA